VRYTRKSDSDESNQRKASHGEVWEVNARMMVRGVLRQSHHALVVTRLYSGAVQESKKRLSTTMTTTISTVKYREYCCCAIPLVNVGIYAVLTEQLALELIVGTLSVATRSSMGPFNCSRKKAPDIIFL
jgi:hypothetical protein